MSEDHSNNQAKISDLRVVELSKSFRSDTLKDKLKQPLQKDGYVCCGHFDYLCVKQLSGEDQLIAIEEDFQKRDNYNYPLYIFHYSCENPDYLEKFWDTKSCFIAVSRVHFNADATADVERLKTALRALQPPEQKAPAQVGELSICIGGEWVHAVFYHTLELGDLVVVLKSNSLPSVLNAIRRMMEVAEVGDVYSFCGIHFGLIQEDMEGAIETWDRNTSSSVFQMNAATALKQNLGHASIRFSLKSIRCAQEFWKLIGCQPYFIVGTADAIIDFSGKPVKDLLRCIACLIFKEFPSRQGTDTINMYDAFEDIITRIGSRYGDVYSEAQFAQPHKLHSKLENAQEYLKNELKKVINTIDEANKETNKRKDTRWPTILGAQVKTLTAMMDNCVTDDLSMLIWPSVCALMVRLEFLIHDNVFIGEDQEADIGDFLNAWDILENDISRMEGQLSQNPELLSSRYYMPATLFAFYMALLDEYNGLLLDIDKKSNCNKNEGYVPLITCNVEPRTRTRCILDPCKDDPPEKNYKQETPLLVSLPVTMIYRPIEAAIVLCHEMSHYTGTFTRKREERYKEILTACAGIIAEKWMLDGGDEYPLIENGDIMLIKDLVERLDARYKSYPPEKATEKHYYIAELSEFLPNVVASVFYDQGFQSSMMQRYVKFESLQHCVLQYSKEFDAQVLLESWCRIENQVGSQLLLYRECYADLMTCLLLDLDADTYVQYMFKSEMLYIIERERQKLQQKNIDNNMMLWENVAEESWYIHVQAALVLSVLNGELSISARQAEVDWLVRLKQCVKYYQEEIEKKEDIYYFGSTESKKKARALTPAEYLPLRRYLKNCKDVVNNAISEGTETKVKREKISNILKTLKEGFSLEYVQKEISEYRNRLLEKIYT